MALRFWRGLRASVLLYGTEARKVQKIIGDTVIQQEGKYSLFYSSLPNYSSGGVRGLSSDGLNSVFCWHCSVLEQNNPNLEAGAGTQPPTSHSG